MKLPDCTKETPDECGFRYGSSDTSTCMYSPLVYDRNGKAVGGGMNKVVRQLGCLTCGALWIGRGTELEWANDAAKWELMPLP